jgi:hypothetical protein
MKTRIALAAIALLLTAGMARQAIAQNARGLLSGKRPMGSKYAFSNSRRQAHAGDPSETQVR